MTPATGPAGLHLIRDRVGIKPVYLARTGRGEWLFASEIRALLAHPDVRAEMDPMAFWHYLTFIVAPAPLTLFRGIFKMPAGYASPSITRPCDGAPLLGLHAVRRADLRARPQLGGRGRESMRLLRQSIARRMVSDVPFGVLLSGGVDS